MFRPTIFPRIKKYLLIQDIVFAFLAKSTRPDSLNLCGSAKFAGILITKQISDYLVPQYNLLFSFKALYCNPVAKLC